FHVTGVQTCALPIYGASIRGSLTSAWQSCGTCHTRQFEAWATSRHVNAYATLASVGAENDPKCIGCHVETFETTNGSRRREQSQIGRASCRERADST